MRVIRIIYGTLRNSLDSISNVEDVEIAIIKMSAALEIYPFINIMASNPNIKLRSSNCNDSAACLLYLATI